MKWGRVFLMMFVLMESAAAQKSQPSDFAFGLPLELDPGGSIYELLLPREVYEAVTRADLGDLRVFNGAGEVAPHLVRSLPAKIDLAKTRVSIPFFPLYGKDSESLEGISLQVKRDAAGAILDVQARAAQSQNRLPAYLLDASRLDRPIDALVFDFDGEPQNLILKINVEYSDRLESWSPLVTAATIANLKYGGFELRQNRILFPPTKAKYFRISWADDETPPTLKVTAAELAAETASPPREWQTLTTTVKTNTPGEYYFTSPGFMPVDRLRVALPLNTISQATFWSRNEDNEEWRRRGSALIYHLQNNGVEITSPEAVVYPAADRHWRMQAEGLGQELPQLEIGWVPQQLLFAAAGNGPFTLAYGKAGVREELEIKLQLSGDMAPEVLSSIKSAKAGAPITLGGESRLRPSALGSNPKNLILWGILILGALMLGWMAVRLFRQMNREEA